MEVYSYLRLLDRATLCLGRGQETVYLRSPQRQEGRVREHRRTAHATSAGQARCCFKMNHSQGQGFTLLRDLRRYLGPENRDFYTLNKMCTVSLA